MSKTIASTHVAFSLLMWVLCALVVMGAAVVAAIVLWGDWTCAFIECRKVFK